MMTMSNGDIDGDDGNGNIFSDDDNNNDDVDTEKFGASTIAV